MLRLFTRRPALIEVETELALAEQAHDLECAILYGASLMGEPLPEVAGLTPTPLRAHRCPTVDLD